MNRLLMQCIAGETHVIVPAFEAGEVLATIEREGITDVALVPTMIQMLIPHPDFGKRDLSTLRRVGYGASPIIASVLEQTLAKLPGVEFAHSYGLTETMIVSTNPPENHGEAAREPGMDSRRARQRALAARRQRDAARVAGEQRRAELGFELLDRDCQRGLGDMQPLSGAPEVECFGQDDEMAHAPHVHVGRREPRYESRSPYVIRCTPC